MTEIQVTDKDRTLEQRVIKQAVTNPDAVNRLMLDGITEDYFVAREDDGGQYGRGLFKMSMQYATESDGALMSQSTFDHRIRGQGTVEQRAKMLAVWSEVQEQEYDPNDLADVCSHLKDRHLARVIKLHAEESNELIGTGDVEAYRESMRDFIARFDAIMDGKQKIKEFDMKDDAQWLSEEYERFRNTPPGIMCGHDPIDSLTGGFQPGESVVLLAPSAGGKSIQMLNMAHHAWDKQGKNVLYFSLEMKRFHCVLRHLAVMYEMPLWMLRKSKYTQEQIEDVVKQMQTRTGGGYFKYIEAMEDPSADFIRLMVRQLEKAGQKPHLLVVDYLGNLVNKDSRQQAAAWEQQKDAFTKLRLMCVEKDIVLITAQQLNAGAIKETRQRKSAGKSAQVGQDGVSGSQGVIHECTYGISLDPDKINNFVTYYGLKMREAEFAPFGAYVDNNTKQIIPFTPEQQEQWANLRGIASFEASGRDSHGVITDYKAADDKVSRGPGGKTVIKRGERTNIASPEDLDFTFDGGADMPPPPW